MKTWAKTANFWTKLMVIVLNSKLKHEGKRSQPAIDVETKNCVV